MGMFIWNIQYNTTPADTGVMPYGSSFADYSDATLPYTKIDLSALETTTGIKRLFRYTNLDSIPELSSTADFNDWSSTFEYSQFLQEITGIDTSSGTSFYGTFNGCKALTTISTLDISNATNAGQLTYIFNMCQALTHIDFAGTIPYSVSLQYSTLLDDDTILSIAYRLVTQSATQTLTLSTALSSKATDYVKLNDDADGLVFCDSTDPDAISTLSDYITNKNWTLAFA